MLEPNEKIMLQRALDLAEQNNDILVKMRRGLRWARFFHSIYWIIVIGTAVGAYYVIQPYVETITGPLGGFSESVEKVKGILHTDDATKP